ncbi:13857_t:CDS:2 [Funneliformis mosseae]|uniref:13857_t:CDS:1 n=1 Tax=Funneliformis mosseae TaxID=27381 RepID=A0A9N8ZQW2_FUNMO|nr:13857_t:CDS:2 [Funneliformis mosseae]
MIDTLVTPAIQTKHLLATASPQRHPSFPKTSLVLEPKETSPILPVPHSPSTSSYISYF